MSVTSETTAPVNNMMNEQVATQSGGRKPVGGKQDFITPAKICVALLLRNYVLMIKNPDEEEDDDDDDDEEMGRDPETAKMNVTERKNFCLMTISLIQGVDRSLKQLIDVIQKDFGFVTNGLSNNANAGLWRAWSRDMKVVCDEEGVGGLMDLNFSLEKMVSAEVQVPHLHRTSVVGRFLRRIVLCFERLNFSEVANLHSRFKRYYEEGKPSLAEATSVATPSIGGVDNVAVGGGDSVISLDLSARSEPEGGLDVSTEVARINQFQECKTATAATSNGLLNIASMEKVSRQQAELYISSQVELLQKAECHAQSPEQVSRAVTKILDENPDLIEAHFLDFLNCLRVREFCGALQAIHKWLVIRAEAGGDKGLTNPADPANATPQDEVDKGFLHAALNLGALYARFDHQVRNYI